MLTPALIAMFAGALIQGTIGFGSALVVAPILVTTDPALLPGASMFAALFITLHVWWRERGSVDAAFVGWATIGRVPGMVIGLTILKDLDVESMEMLVGLIVMMGVLISLSGWKVEVRRRSILITGLVSGIAGTTTSAGGPPLALLSQNWPGPKLRGTLNAYFTISILTTLPFLHLIDRFNMRELVAGLLFIPVIWIGMVASGFLIPHINQQWSRSLVLSFSGASAVWLLL
ncbi:MAG: sulfite exporter TauE/SafE family protein [Magnetococcales bacterium]|nr:sulfite exporter TauE/SafE family protein [Magnetococcales bacterium]